MIDNFIRGGAQFDLITALCALIHQIVFKGVGYNVPEDCGVSAYSIRDLLKAQGVKSRWWAISGPTGSGLITFTVARRDDWKAQGVMNAYGIPFTGGKAYARPPFLPGQGQPGNAPAVAQGQPAGGDWSQIAAANLQARRAGKGKGR